MLVSACFEAFRRIFEAKTSRLRHVFAAYQGRLPSEGVELLAREACQLAGQFLNILIRAIDYCPSHHCTFGEYLRAMITADTDLVADDPWAYREAMVTAFRRYGITVPDVLDLSEQSLLWKRPARPILVEALRFSQLRLDCVNGLIQWSDDARQVAAAEALGRAVCTPEHGRDCGLMRPGGKVEPPRVMSLRTLRRVAPDGNRAAPGRPRRLLLRRLHAGHRRQRARALRRTEGHRFGAAPPRPAPLAAHAARRRARGGMGETLVGVGGPAAPPASRAGAAPLTGAKRAPVVIAAGRRRETACRS